MNPRPKPRILSLRSLWFGRLTNRTVPEPAEGPVSDDILVKFLLNENETSIPIKTDCAPYYHWSDVKRFWEGHPAITQ